MPRPPRSPPPGPEIRGTIHVPIRAPEAKHRGSTRHLHVRVTEHVDDFVGDWQRALAGLVREVEPRASVPDAVYDDRGCPEFEVVLAAEVSGDEATVIERRIAQACDALIRAAREDAAREGVTTVRRRVDGFVERGSGDARLGEALAAAVEAGTPLAGRDFSRAHVGGRNLEGADLRGARLTQVDFTGAHMKDADLRDADLRRAVLRFCTLEGAQLDGARLAGAEVDPVTFEHSRWSADEFVALHRDHGLNIIALDRFPETVRRALGDGNGLTLTFDTRLHPFDSAAFTLLVAEVLGDGHDVTVVERSDAKDEPPAWIRINGSRPEDLLVVAEAFYDRAWRSAEVVVEDRALQKAMSSGLALLLGRLDETRNQLVELRANVAFLGDADVREAITDMATDRADAKRKREFQTRAQRLVAAIASEFKKRTVDVVLGEGVADTAIEIAGEVASDAIAAIEDASVARFDPKPESK